MGEVGLIITVDELVPSGLTDGLTDEAVFRVVADIAEGARHEWMRLAGAELTTSRRDYLQAIQPVVHRPGVAILALIGQPANLVEHGSGRVDMRDTLLGPNVPVAPAGKKGKRRAKDGSFYRAIPFRHGTPGTGGAVGVPMGDPYRGTVDDAKKLGRAVYTAAKKLGPGDRLQAHLTYGRGKSKATIPRLRPHHKTDIYAGMQKSRSAYQKAIQSKYVTFRTISTKTGVGWIRPATPGIDLIPRVQDYVSRVSSESFQAYINGLKGGT